MRKDGKERDRLNQHTPRFLEVVISYSGLFTALPLGLPAEARPQSDEATTAVRTPPVTSNNAWQAFHRPVVGRERCLIRER